MIQPFSAIKLLAAAISSGVATISVKPCHGTATMCAARASYARFARSVRMALAHLEEQHWNFKHVFEVAGTRAAIPNCTA